MKDVFTRGFATRRGVINMIIVDENRLTDQTIEMIGHDMGIDDVGLTFEGYVEKVKKILRKAPLSVIKGSKARELKLCGLRVYLYSLTKRPLVVSEYAKWLGQDLTMTVRTEFTRGIEDIKEKMTG